jgi:hypothetical protein
MFGWMISMTLAATGSVTEVSPVRVYGGWIAGCDNENICTAIRTVDAVDSLLPQGSIPFLQIRHHPHRDAIPEIRIIDPANPAPDAMLRPGLSFISLDFRERSSEGELRIYHARPELSDGTQSNAASRYRFSDEDVRTILYGLRVAVPASIAIGAKQIPLNSTQLDEALAHFDWAQDLADTPGALVLQPSGPVMFDYAHPWAPDAPLVQLSRFSPASFEAWFKRYLQQHPGRKVKHEAEPERGLVTTIRYDSFDFDCGVFERWGHDRTADQLVLVERREMPVCVGIGDAHWIRTYRADTISPET